MQEIWRDIKDYEGYYQVSNLGNVRSLDRTLKNKNGLYTRKGKMLKKLINSKGYYVVNLRKNCTHKIQTIHRIIAETFISNKNNYPCVNHIDGNKLNNSLDNLEWCTYSHNIKEAFRLGLNKYTYKENFNPYYWKGKKGIEHSKSKQVNQYDLKGNLLNKWGSITEASEKTGINYAYISLACNHKRKCAGNYVWRFENGE